MQFAFTHHLPAPVADVTDALCDPAFYAVLAESPKLGAPELLSRDVAGDKVTMRVRYRFTGDLSSAVTAVVNPEKLTWIEVSVHDLAAHSVRFDLEPDHYADRLKASGAFQLRADPADPDVTVRRASGDVKVRALLVAGAVEKAIISGLGEHLDEDVDRIRRFLTQP